MSGQNAALGSAQTGLNFATLFEFPESDNLLTAQANYRNASNRAIMPELPATPDRIRPNQAIAKIKWPATQVIPG